MLQLALLNQWGFFMHTNTIMLMANVNRSQIEISNTHYNIKSIPITVDDAIMNDVMYSAAENKKGMATMVGNPVTLGHPIIDGQNASGRSGGGLDDHYSGGTIKRVYNKSNVWYADASIKKSILNAQDGGKEYADMLENKDAIGVSTGLMFEDNDMSGVDGKGRSYSKTAINQQYDHLAMLANEQPAGGGDTVMRFNVADVMPEQNALSRFLDTAKAWFVNESQNSYNSPDGKQPEFTNNQDGEDIMDRTQIIGLLSGKGISVNADISDADLMAMLTNAVPEQFKKESKKSEDADDDGEDEDDKPKKKAKNSEEVPAWAQALLAKVNTLETSLAANHNVELDGLKTQMKAMTVNKLSDSVIDKMDPQEMKDHLAANGQVGFNATSGYVQTNSNDSGYSADMPE